MLEYLRKKSQWTGLTEKWLEGAKYAPSADNMQPWAAEFVILEHSIQVTLHVTTETLSHPSQIDSNFTTSWIALGAFAKNLEILAMDDGFKLESLVTQDSQYGPRWVMQFQPKSIASSVLSKFIRVRQTNRYVYQAQDLRPLDRVFVEELKSENADIKFVSAPRVQKILNIFSFLDAQRYVHKKMFQDFISKLRFGKNVEQTQEGLSGVTLGIPLIFRISLAFMQKLSFLWFLNLGPVQWFSSWMGSTRLLKNSSGILILRSPSDTPMDWFNLGRALQNTWLELTARGISVQPMGVTLLLYRSALEKSGDLRNLHSLIEGRKRAKWESAAQKFHDVTGIDPTLPHIVLRIGYSKKANVPFSLRKPLSLASSKS